jgi:hypothetical protein
MRDPYRDNLASLLSFSAREKPLPRSGLEYVMRRRKTGARNNTSLSRMEDRLLQEEGASGGSTASLAT